MFVTYQTITCIFFYASCVWSPHSVSQIKTRRPASADRTARRQGQVVDWRLTSLNITQMINTTQLPTDGRATCRIGINNAPAFNAGRSLCVQLSRERSYPMPIYWYHSKGNWLRYYTFAAEIFIQWNFPADFSSFIVEIVQKTTNLVTLSPFWGS